MSPLVQVMMMMFSVLIPQKVFFAPDQPLTVTNKGQTAVALVLTDFNGKVQDATPAADSVAPGASVDLKTLFAALNTPGTYVCYAVDPANKAKALTDFVGTPLVVEVKDNKEPGAGPGVMLVKIEPLRYAVMTTDSGPLTMEFYYDVAPNTVDNFLTLSEGGYYDGLVFHRIVPGFVIQGGDPLGTDTQRAGSGGPGYTIGAEFNDHPHEAGVLSMARTSDPNSGGSQFFICLDYKQTQQLDHQYTAFGKVTDGMDAVTKIAASPVPDQSTGRPATPPVIQKVEVLPVTARHDPYAALFGGK